ncbi:MAG: hypothetical protein QY307_05705 [Acidimicrobiia bacterium]|nr:MAG: hypothetical protein QY307_05705 [Acidimicrobiia bacterium]
MTDRGTLAIASVLTLAPLVGAALAARPRPKGMDVVYLATTVFGAIALVVAAWAAL